VGTKIAIDYFETNANTKEEEARKINLNKENSVYSI